MKIRTAFLPIALLVFFLAQAKPTAPVNFAVLRGFAPFAHLLNTDEGKRALDGNQRISGEIQTGLTRNEILQPFAAQQQQALRDAYVTAGNLQQISDGLGTKLGGTYAYLYPYLPDKSYARLPLKTEEIVHYANKYTARDSEAAKYLYANQTTDGKKPVSAFAAKLVTSADGTVDVYGKAYNLLAGSNGANPIGNSRPFQTYPNTVFYDGKDFLGQPSSNRNYLSGTEMNLLDSPSFPSGHATYGYTSSVLLGILIPSRYPQMVTRAAVYGNSRIVVGAHYAMDVIGGRTLALYDLAHLLASDPNLSPAKIRLARAALAKDLEAKCKAKIEQCAKEDKGIYKNPTANETFVAATLDYNLPAVYPARINQREDVAKLAPEAGWLLKDAYPSLTILEADKILTETEGPGGGFLDNGSSFGVYSRLNLYAAAIRAEQLSKTPKATPAPKTAAAPKILPAPKPSR